MGREMRGSRRTPLIVTDFGEIIDTDPYGRVTANPDNMSMPCRCNGCGLVFDGGRVTVTARYADCSVWKCPGEGCNRTHDSRPAWSGAPGARMGYTDLNAAKRATRRDRQRPLR